MQTTGMISIWFFIGLLLAAYGIIIVLSSMFVAAPASVVLANLNAGFWWGLFLLIVGLFYTIYFRPGTGR